MTDAELRDAAWAHLEKTTIGWLKPNGQPRPTPGTHWKAAKEFLDQIGSPLPPPPPPPVGSLPAVISQGGTYTGTRVGTVQVRTAEPVTIQNARIESTGNATLLDCDFAGAKVTVKNTTFQGGLGMAVYAQAFDKLWIENCDVNGTWGIRPGTGRSGCVCVVLKTRFRNQLYVPGQSPYNVSHPFQAVEVTNPSHAELRWIESIQEFGKSQTEDIISLYRSNKFRVHDFYLQGAYPAKIGDHYTGGGVLVDSGGGSDNEIFDGQVVDTMNYCIAIAGGQRNKLYSCRAFSTGKDAQGNVFTGVSSGGNGMVVWDATPGAPYGQNVAYANVVGANYVAGGRNDWWCPGASNNVEAENSHYSGAIDKALVAAEYLRWQQKVAAAGITIGAP